MKRSGIFLLFLLFLSYQIVEAKVNIDGFDFEAHRGGRAARPENTLQAFAYAMELGVTTLELDTHLTKDGYVVVSHNPILNPVLTKDKNGNYIKNPREIRHSYNDLKRG